jgi:hypothetical protein
MNGYCQAGLEEAIGRRWGLGQREHSGRFLGRVIVYISFFKKKIEWEVPRVTVGHMRWILGLCCSCLFPSFRPGDAKTSAPFFTTSLGDRKRVMAATADAVNCR